MKLKDVWAYIPGGLQTGGGHLILGVLHHSGVGTIDQYINEGV